MLVLFYFKVVSEVFEISRMAKHIVPAMTFNSGPVLAACTMKPLTSASGVAVCRWGVASD